VGLAFVGEQEKCQSLSRASHSGLRRLASGMLGASEDSRFALQ
jgi:hypothetical protein